MQAPHDTMVRRGSVRNLRKSNSIRLSGKQQPWMQEPMLDSSIQSVNADDFWGDDDEEFLTVDDYDIQGSIEKKQSQTQYEGPAVEDEPVVKDDDVNLIVSGISNDVVSVTKDDQFQVHEEDLVYDWTQQNEDDAQHAQPPIPDDQVQQSNQDPAPPAPADGYQDAAKYYDEGSVSEYSDDLPLVDWMDVPADGEARAEPDENDDQSLPMVDWYESGEIEFSPKELESEASSVDDDVGDYWLPPEDEIKPKPKLDDGQSESGGSSSEYTSSLEDHWLPPEDDLRAKKPQNQEPQPVPAEEEEESTDDSDLKQPSPWLKSEPTPPKKDGSTHSRRSTRSSKHSRRSMKRSTHLRAAPKNIPVPAQQHDPAQAHIDAISAPKLQQAAQLQRSHHSKQKKLPWSTTLRATPKVQRQQQGNNNNVAELQRPQLRQISKRKSVRRLPNPAQSHIDAISSPQLQRRQRSSHSHHRRKSMKPNAAMQQQQKLKQTTRPRGSPRHLNTTCMNDPAQEHMNAISGPDLRRTTSKERSPRRQGASTPKEPQHAIRRAQLRKTAHKRRSMFPVAIPFDPNQQQLDDNSRRKSDNKQKVQFEDINNASERSISLGSLEGDTKLDTSDNLHNDLHKSSVKLLANIFEKKSIGLLKKIQSKNSGIENEETHTPRPPPVASKFLGLLGKVKAKQAANSKAEAKQIPAQAKTAQKQTIAQSATQGKELRAPEASAVAKPISGAGVNIDNNALKPIIESEAPSQAQQLVPERDTQAQNRQISHGPSAFRDETAVAPAPEVDAIVGREIPVNITIPNRSGKSKDWTGILVGGEPQSDIDGMLIDGEDNQLPISKRRRTAPGQRLRGKKDGKVNPATLEASQEIDGNQLDVPTLILVPASPERQESQQLNNSVAYNKPRSRMQLHQNPPQRAQIEGHANSAKFEQESTKANQDTDKKQSLLRQNLTSTGDLSTQQIMEASKTISIKDPPIEGKRWQIPTSIQEELDASKDLRQNATSQRQEQDQEYIKKDNPEINTLGVNVASNVFHPKAKMFEENVAKGSKYESQSPTPKRWKEEKETNETEKQGDSNCTDENYSLPTPTSITIETTCTTEGLLSITPLAPNRSMDPPDKKKNLIEKSQDGEKTTNTDLHPACPTDESSIEDNIPNKSTLAPLPDITSASSSDYGNLLDSIGVATDSELNTVFRLADFVSALSPSQRKHFSNVVRIGMGKQTNEEDKRVAPKSVVNAVRKVIGVTVGDDTAGQKSVMTTKTKKNMHKHIAQKRKDKEVEKAAVVVYDKNEISYKNIKQRNHRMTITYKSKPKTKNKDHGLLGTLRENGEKWQWQNDKPDPPEGFVVRRSLPDRDPPELTRNNSTKQLAGKYISKQQPRAYKYSPESVNSTSTSLPSTEYRPVVTFKSSRNHSLPLMEYRPVVVKDEQQYLHMRGGRSGLATPTKSKTNSVVATSSVLQERMLVTGNVDDTVSSKVQKTVEVYSLPKNNYYDRLNSNFKKHSDAASDSNTILEKQIDAPSDESLLNDRKEYKKDPPMVRSHALGNLNSSVLDDLSIDDNVAILSSLKAILSSLERL